MQESTLRLRDYRAFLRSNAASIAEFKTRQQAAFEAERERWNESASRAAPAAAEEQSTLETTDGANLPEGCLAVSSPVSGSVWTVGVEPGARVRAGDELMVVEAMKMEIPIAAEETGEIVEVRCMRGKAVSAGETLLVVRPLQT
jgi:urea carboxylase